MLVPRILQPDFHLGKYLALGVSGFVPNNSVELRARLETSSTTVFCGCSISVRNLCACWTRGGHKAFIILVLDETSHKLLGTIEKRAQNPI